MAKKCYCPNCGYEIGAAKNMVNEPVMEIVLRKKPILYDSKITSSKDVNDFMHRMYKDQDMNIDVREFAHVLYINNNNKIQSYQLLSIGGISGCVIDIVLVLRGAIDALCKNMILVHNHPSNSLKPSASDNEITEKLKNSCKLLNMTLFDHIITAQSEAYYSYADDGML